MVLINCGINECPSNVLTKHPGQSTSGQPQQATAGAEAPDTVNMEMQENLTQVGNILISLKTWLWTRVMRLRFNVDKQIGSQKTDTSKDYINSANARAKKLSESWNYHCTRLFICLPSSPSKTLPFQSLKFLIGRQCGRARSNSSLWLYVLFSPWE